MTHRADLQILYEDNHCVVVYKPAGILIQGDRSGDECLMDVVKAYLKEKYKKPGAVFLGLVHRLDRNVSGVVVFAKTSKGASRLSEQFRSHAVTKIYHALVEGELSKKSGELNHYILKDEKTNTVSVFDSPTKDSKEANLSYEVVRSDKNTSLVKITLGTGRSHQIRAQFAHIGHPLIGDQKYGSTHKIPNQELALCATSLTFTPPTKEEQVVISIQPPSWA